MYKDLINAHKNNFEDFLFYDIEIFLEDAIVVFKDIDGNTIGVFHNDFKDLYPFIREKVLVGYNNYHYDDLIISAMLQGKEVKILKCINDSIINNRGYVGSVNPELFTLDCFQQINVAHSSLKKVEANIGLSIDESKVDFDIDRKLTEDELEDTIKYCKQDVNATINIFKLRWFSYFIPKLMIVNMLPENLRSRAIRWNTTTITASILTGNEPVKKWNAIQLGDTPLKTTEMLSKAPLEARELWTNKDPEKKKYTHYDLGCIFEFSQGGLHGVNDNGTRKFSDVKLLDVTSLYPNIIIKLNALGEATKTYKGIVEERIKVKHTDKVLSDALKLVINSTYGLMKNEYSKLYNPKAAMSVCVYGQIILFDLCRRLRDAGYTLININTDGVAFWGNIPDEEFIEVQKEWENDYGFQLELSEFKTWIQKDVNNYVAKTKDGIIKVKGAEVNHFYDPIEYVSDPLHMKAGITWSGTNSKSIIHHCIVNKLLNNASFNQTIQENLNAPILFQFVLQAGSSYIGTIDENGKEYQKVNRVFATKDGVTLKKVKEGCNPQYFPNAPKNMFVFNDDLRNFDNFKDIVDIDFYLELAEEKYQKLWK